MSRSIVPSGGNDRIYTPLKLAQDIVDYFDPYGPSGNGKVMEPCKGDGAFIQALYNNGVKHGKEFSIDCCEIDEGYDFLKYPSDNVKFSHVVTNPPFSKFRGFLQKSMDIADNVIFLSLVNAFFFKARLRDTMEKGFGFKEIVFVDTPPKPWPQFGIQLGVIHLQRGYTGDTKFTNGFN